MPTISALHFLDTNVRLYSISDDLREAKKRRHAGELLDDEHGALSVQILGEYYAQATRKSRTNRLSHELAAGLIDTWTRFPIHEMNLPLLREALEIRRAHGFSFWDALILAAAKALGCRKFFTEDLSHGRQVYGILIVNPFR